MERRFNSLRELREYYKYSLSDLSNRMGVTAPTIWQWEQKPNEWIKPKHRRLLEEVFSKADISEALDADWTPELRQKMEEEEKEPVQLPCVTNYEGPELMNMIRELTEVFFSLSDEGKALLVDHADFLYHRENGMKLPRVARPAEEMPEDVWEAIQEIRQTPVTP